MSGKPRPLEFWDARREALLEAAKVELAATGVEGLTLDRVARRAGVSKGAVQYAFGSKDQLLGELAHATLFDIFSDGLATTIDAAGEPRLEDVIGGLVRGLASDEDRLRALVLVMGTARRSEAARDALTGFYAEIDPRIGQALLDAGLVVREEDLPALVRGVRGMIVGMFIHWTVHPQGRSLDDVAHEVRTVLARLLGSGSPAGAR
jgi:AcrR family transcriptional regulator